MYKQVKQLQSYRDIEAVFSIEYKLGISPNLSGESTFHPVFGLLTFGLKPGGYIVAFPVPVKNPAAYKTDTQKKEEKSEAHF